MDLACCVLWPHSCYHHSPVCHQKCDRSARPNVAHVLTSRVAGSKGQPESRYMPTARKSSQKSLRCNQATAGPSSKYVSTPKYCRFGSLERERWSLIELLLANFRHLMVSACLTVFNFVSSLDRCKTAPLKIPSHFGCHKVIIIINIIVGSTIIIVASSSYFLFPL